jgi:hypothetical protein
MFLFPFLDGFMYVFTPFHIYHYLAKIYKNSKLSSKPGAAETDFGWSNVPRKLIYSQLCACPDAEGRQG